MDVSRSERDDGVLLQLKGNVDIYTSPELRGELKVSLDQRASKIVVDLAEVTFVDSSGLATLIEALQKVKGYDGKLVLCGLTVPVRGVFELSNLDSIFDIRDNVEAAFGE